MMPPITPSAAVPATAAPGATVRGGALAPAPCASQSSLWNNLGRRRCPAKRSGAGSFFKGGLAAVLLAAPAIAAPPPGADPNSAIARWVQSLKDLRGVSCCSLADCRPVHARITDAGTWQAWIDRDTFGASAPDTWVDVAAEVVAGTRSAGPPPDTHVWACWYGGAVRCLATTDGG